MSGGGDGGNAGDWRPRPEVGGGGEDRCAIVERTILNSPVAAVIANLAAGDMLDISLDMGPPRRVIATNQQGAVAGAITSPRLVDIIECLQGGYVYLAEVLSVQGGRVEIEIRPA